jgi:Spy/CpxP family protein refolding chaperone
MSRIRLLAIGTMLTFALTALAQQTTTTPGSPAKGSVPTVEEQLKALTDKLGLTGDQQPKIKGILEALRDDTQKLVGNKSVPSDERLQRVQARRKEADKKIREILTEEQSLKLDQLEQGPHPELHGDVTGRH